MSAIHLILIAAGYFALLLLLSFATRGRHDNEAFFRAGRQSPWWAVAFGMIGASVSGVTFVSVPGMVTASGMTYLQMCMGFVFGYLLVAFVLLPVYYRLDLTTIYTYLHYRFGLRAHLTGSVMFFFSKLVGASIRLFLVATILQRLIFDSLGIPFWANTALLLLLMWCYTKGSGIRTIVWSDCMQTLVLLTALVLIICQLASQMGLHVHGMARLIAQSPMSRVFEWDDPASKNYFWKQFLSGIFVVVVMTGLDQDSMQKNLTCRTLRQSQLNMCVNGLCYLPVNLLFLCLGILMATYNATLPAPLPQGDALLPALCGGGYLGQAALVCFTLGIVAAAFSSADSAMASLTTSVCMDILRRPSDERLRKLVHPLIAVAFFGFILVVEASGSNSVIDAVYTACGYTYGPLLGLFAFGLTTRLMPRPAYIPFICMASPLLCFGLQYVATTHWQYRFGYELLMVNGLLTYTGLWLASLRQGAQTRTLVLAAAVACAGALPARAGRSSFTPTDHGQALVNPGMGWTMHFYSNLLQNYGSRLSPHDVLDDFPGLSTVYLRLPWSFVQPQEDIFCWETVDTPAGRWIQAGKKVALRITATENWMQQATPQWVFDAGARYYEVNGYKEPEYDDSVFLDKLDRFLAAMARRYDNNPNVAFIDIGHFGMWGEGHTVLTTPVHGKQWGLDTQKRIIDLYCKHFAHTQLVISDDFAGHDAPVVHSPVIDYALSKGVSLRDDSILVQPAPRHWYHSQMAQLFWPTMPVVLEHEHLGSSVDRGAWNQELLLQSVEEYHASYMSIHWWPREELSANRDIIDRINRRMGYRLQAACLQWPDTIRKGEPFVIHSEWRNAGVAPCYVGGYPCFTIKDNEGGIVSMLVDERLNVGSLPVGKPGQASFVPLDSRFVVAQVFADSFGSFSRSCPTGVFNIYFSIGQADGTPLIALPYDQDDGHKRYLMGTVTLTD